MLTEGAPVRCPPDRGDEGYVGTVVEAGAEKHRSHQGHAFRWVTVRHPRGHKTVWPSNRLRGV